MIFVGNGSSYKQTILMLITPRPYNKMNKQTIRLFKGILIDDKNYKVEKKEWNRINEKTIKKGFLLDSNLVANYSGDIDELINLIEKEIGLTSDKLNNSFHKSWNKIKESSMEQLVMEQIIHYMTTYGFEELGIYNEESVYIPNEKLEIPELKEGINLTIIKGYTKDELKEKLLNLLSGIALKEDTIQDVIEVIRLVELSEKEIDNIKNKEVKCTLYDELDILPENPIEFLRYLIYITTEKTLLIKNKELIDEIKESNKLQSLRLFNKYKRLYGLEKLSSIFYRFKPLFLGFKLSPKLNTIINKIRKLAVKHHKPMKEDYLNSITSKIGKDTIDIEELRQELNKVSVFRKIRLGYALKFRLSNPSSILYRVRNGKSYSTTFSSKHPIVTKQILDVVLDSIVKDISKKVKGKKIFIPEHINYTLPSTEKQFTGYFPSGSYIAIPKDMIFGIHWENVDGNRIDLDLSLINQEEKFGWDASYRGEDGTILFSGDMTSAPKPKGATELFYVKRQRKTASILLVNYFNYEKEIEVPFKIIVAKEQLSRLKQNYVVNPNNVLSIAKSKINQKQKVLGLLVTTSKECRFYFTETYLGKSITSSNSDFVENTRKYLFDFYENAISLKDILEKAGAKLVKSKYDIDLSPEKLEKDTILNLIN